MFDKDKSTDQQLDALRALDGAEGILKGVVSSTTTGIVGDKADLERRKAVYGENLKPLPPPSSILESFKQEVKNIMWVIIGATAIISGFCGIYKEGIYAITTALSILFIGIVLIIISSLVDYCKDKKFIQLSSLVKEENATVIRGKFGATERVSIWSLVVGDIVMITEG
jgi:magnesium-transporting ATPase (P-type)